MAQRWVMVGTILGDEHGWHSDGCMIVSAMLGDGWHIVGFCRNVGSCLNKNRVPFVQSLY